MKTHRAIITAVLASVCIWAFIPVAGPGTLFSPGAACAQDDWKKEFDDVCSKTQDAMAFNTDELKALVDRCDKLKPQVEALDGAQGKVYSKRLKMCRDLFSFTLETKEKKTD